MKEIMDSISDAVKNRLTNSVYGTFFVSWVVFHWNFLYSLFALDQSAILQHEGVLKNVYLWQKYFSIHDKYFWFSWLMPMLMTYLIIRWFPKWFLVDAYSCEERYKTNKRIIKLTEAKTIRQVEADLEVQTARKAEAIAKQVIEEKKIKESDPTIQWEEEYKKLKIRNIFSYFKTLYEIVYKNGGGLYGDQSYQLAMPLIAYLDSSEALKINNGSVQLTTKGNFFMRKYLEEIS